LQLNAFLDPQRSWRVSLHYFLDRHPNPPEPVAELLRQVAFPAERRVPSHFEHLLRRLGPR